MGANANSYAASAGRHSSAGYGTRPDRASGHATNCANGGTGYATAATHRGAGYPTAAAHRGAGRPEPTGKRSEPPKHSRGHDAGHDTAPGT